MRATSPERLAALVEPWFVRAGYCGALDAAGRAYLASLMPMAQASVDRLDEVAPRLAFVADFDADRSLAREDLQAEMSTEGARAVARALAQELAGAARIMDREAFRAVAGRVRDSTGQRGRALFHPIRVILTGEPRGPELDLAVPAVERGAELPPSAGWRTIVGCRERAHAFATALSTV
jgi:hypothetical protein